MTTTFKKKWTKCAHGARVCQAWYWPVANGHSGEAMVAMEAVRCGHRLRAEQKLGAKHGQRLKYNVSNVKGTIYSNQSQCFDAHALSFCPHQNKGNRIKVTKAR